MKKFDLFNALSGMCGLTQVIASRLALQKHRSQVRSLDVACASISRWLVEEGGGRKLECIGGCDVSAARQLCASILRGLSLYINSIYKYYHHI